MMTDRTQTGKLGKYSECDPAIFMDLNENFEIIDGYMYYTDYHIKQLASEHMGLKAQVDSLLSEVDNLKESQERSRILQGALIVLCLILLFV